MARNILILTNSISGLHSFRKEVVKAICDEGYKVIISAPEDDSKTDFFISLGCEISINKFSLRGKKPLADIRLMLSYRKLMKEKNPIAVLTYTIKPNVYGGLAARICHVPQLANITGLGDAIENGGWLQKLTLLLYKIGLGNANCVFFQNRCNREFFIQERIVRNSSFLLPGSGVNLQYHSFQEYPVEGEPIRFLYIGRLLKDKGTDELLETFKEIKKKHPQIEFQIIADYVENEYRGQIENLVELGVLRFLGAQADVRPFIGVVHCTIMPSYHEGMSNVNLESAANGRPVITTNVPGCRETVDDGKNGFLVEVRSVKSLIEAVERFINLPYKQKVLMGEEARKKVEREFDRQIIIDAYLNRIKTLKDV